MARAEQVKALLRAYAGDEEARFLSIAMQVAADEAQRGHNRLATELRDLIDEARLRRKPLLGARPVALAQPKGELSELLTAHYPQVHLSSMVVSAGVEAKLTRVLKEQRAHTNLESYGLTPRRKLLLVGPPGTGKTLTASILACELKLPLFVTRLDSLITKFMGESASKLRLVFDALKTSRGVYLFDEFDSIGLERGGQNDVAEMRRTLNMFLQLIEQDDSNSLIVAATNHGDSLDKALFRRFDDVIEYTPPDNQQIILLLKNSLAMLDASSLNYDEIAKRAQGLSHSDVVRAARDALKDAVLSNQNEISQETVMQHVDERQAAQRALKR